MNEKDIERFFSKIDRDGPFCGKLNSKCWSWKMKLDKDGYGRFRYKNKKRGAHRISYMYFYGNIDDNLLVCHKCNNPSCVNPDHLYLGTASDNKRDEIESGRTSKGTRNGKYTHPEKTPRGERAGNSKLTENDVIEIRKTYNAKAGKTIMFLSEKYGVGTSTIWSVISRQTWTHI